MGFRFNKRIKIAKGVSLNLSKRGISTSVKVGKSTINSRGRVTTNLGNGLSYQTSLTPKKRKIKRGNEIKEISVLDGDPRLSMIETLEKSIYYWNLGWGKTFNIFMKICLAIISVLSLLLGLIYPFMFIIAIVSGYGAFKFNTIKFKDKKIKECQQQIDQLIEEIENDSMQL